jgi:hypothetical protein
MSKSGYLMLPVEEKIDGEPAVSAGDSGPAAQHRNRHVMRKAGVQMDMEGTDWACWSMSRAVRLLNSNVGKNEGDDRDRHREAGSAEPHRGHHRLVPDVPESAVMPHKLLCFR